MKEVKVAEIKGTGSWLTITETDGCPKITFEMEDDCCTATFEFFPDDTPKFIVQMRGALDELERQWEWQQAPYQVPRDMKKEIEKLKGELK